MTPTCSLYPERHLSGHAIREAVSAAGEKAAVKGLCKRCDQIVGWFFLDPEIFAATFKEAKKARFEPICDVKAAKLSPSCKLCTFLKAITPGNGKYVNYGPARLGRSTVRGFFDFNSTRYDKVPIFYVAPRYGAQSPTGISTAFGFSNADPSRDGVAIRQLNVYADLSLVRDWVQTCGKLHVNCVPKSGVRLQGFVLIDCKDGRNVLVDGCSDLPMQYVTLSYVWGSEISDGPDSSGRLPLVLPDLITGVIKVVLALGYRYLWIDRYCVPQSDSSGIKSLLLQSMDQIYSQSALTIIAATTKYPSEGLAGITRPRVIEQNSIQLKSVRLLQWVHDIHSEVEGSVWNTRGWTYQEAVLSRRRLVFTEKQCYFQCGLRGEGGTRMESIDYDLMTKRGSYQKNRISCIFPPRAQQVERHHGWDLRGLQDSVNDYAKRQLSSDSDVLPAFLGILGMLTAESPDFHGHIHGVPIFEPTHKDLQTDTVGTFITGITWHFDTDHEGFNLATTTIPARRHVLPSWTWCDWVTKSPSPHPIKWEESILSMGHPRRDMVLDTTISLEFEDGTVLPWPRDSKACSLARRAMSIGNVCFLRITGWLTNFTIPMSSLNAGGNPWTQFVDYIPCGPYWILGSMLFWLQMLAHERGMKPTDNKEYVFKAWVFAPVVLPDYNPCDPWDDAWMTILGEASIPAVFERIEVCRVIMGADDIGDWKEKDVEDMADIFGWELQAFKPA